MIKLFVKCIVILLALQSAMDFLRQQEIIEGSIKINYQIIQQKVFAAIPTKKIANGMFKFATEGIKNVVVNDDARYHQISYDQTGDRNSRFKIVNHVVNYGETLDDLSQRYGVHWRVIQRVNHLENERELFVGQKLKIPSKMHQLI